MADDAFRTLVEVAAYTFAQRSCLRSRPGDEVGATAHAGRSWRRYVAMTLDFLALRTVLAEAESLPPETARPSRPSVLCVSDAGTRCTWAATARSIPRWCC
jgi:hypothetical protein